MHLILLHADYVNLAYYRGVDAVLNLGGGGGGEK